MYKRQAFYTAINSFFDTQEKLESINSKVDTVKSTIKPITLYTQQKKQAACDLGDQRENLRQQQLEKAKKIILEYIKKIKKVQ